MGKNGTLDNQRFWVDCHNCMTSFVDDNMVCPCCGVSCLEGLPKPYSKEDGTVRVRCSICMQR